MLPLRSVKMNSTLELSIYLSLSLAWSHIGLLGFWNSIQKSIISFLKKTHVMITLYCIYRIFWMRRKNTNNRNTHVPWTLTLMILSMNPVRSKFKIHWQINIHTVFLIICIFQPFYLLCFIKQLFTLLPVFLRLVLSV